MSGDTSRWDKHGLLTARPAGGQLTSHVALPSVFEGLDGARWMYASSRDARGRSHVWRCPIEAGADGRLRLDEAQAAIVLGPGELGAFDDAGVTNSCVVRDGDRVLLYYSGWTRGVSVPFYFYVGLAESYDDGASFVRVSRAPILERTNLDPFLTASPAVLPPAGRHGWRMWYVTCTGWDDLPLGPRHRYLIRGATSSDGVVWDRDESIAVDFAHPGEYAHGRPCVRADANGGEGLDMWFCSRGDAYRFAQARSEDGRTWCRVDYPATLPASSLGWDAEMQCYPHVFGIDGATYKLYNGNGYGRSGVGSARLVDAVASSKAHDRGIAPS